MYFVKDLEKNIIQIGLGNISDAGYSRGIYIAPEKLNHSKNCTPLDLRLRVPFLAKSMFVFSRARNLFRSLGARFPRRFSQASLLRIVVAICSLSFFFPTSKQSNKSEVRPIKLTKDAAFERLLSLPLSSYISDKKWGYISGRYPVLGKSGIGLLPLRNTLPDGEDDTKRFAFFVKAPKVTFYRGASEKSLQIIPVTQCDGVFVFLFGLRETAALIPASPSVSHSKRFVISRLETDSAAETITCDTFQSLLEENFKKGLP